MGQLISRALRRITQCSSNQTQRQQECGAAAGADERQQLAQQKRVEQDEKPTVQSIPVGQSIDSADYAAFEASRQTTKRATEESIVHALDKENDGLNNVENVSPSGESSPSKNSENTPQVEEEAVIKIQALVRGHLTRKALKDAQQQNATPPPNALGQSQFDEDSLTRNPLSAVFSLPSLLNIVDNPASITSKTGDQASGRVTPKLESIAEESQNSMSLDKKDGQTEESTGPRRLTASQSLSLSVNNAAESRDSVSPVPSEANASIDLNCDSPASVSIDISDHNIQPTDKLASVLHHKASSGPAGDNDPTTVMGPRVVEPTLSISRNNTPPPSPIMHNSLMNSHSVDPAEAAAIRIQSAFRGYHTRKHSPYRRRSPNSTPPTGSDTIQTGNGSSSEKRNELRRQRDATVVEDENDSRAPQVSDVDENGRLAEATETDRRQSRQRQRDAGPALEAQSIISAEESQATDESTVIEVHPMQSSDPTKEAGGVLVENLDEELGLSATGDERQQLAQAGGLEGTGSSNALDNIAESMGEESLGYTISQSNLPQSSLGAKSAISFELDTDSSNLGAALSLNEEIPDVVNEQLSMRTNLRKPSNVSEEDHSIGANLVASLADESISQDASASCDKDQEAALDEATDALAAALDKLIDDAPSIDAKREEVSEEITFNVDEQQSIELESDDIERRDPRGHATEDRAKSPQIKNDRAQPSFIRDRSSSSQEEGQESATVKHEAENENHQRLVVVSPDEAFASGPSSPALASSNGATSSDEGNESDQEQGAETHPEKGQQQEEQRQGPNSGGNKKKRNRNKKKGKK